MTLDGIDAVMGLNFMKSHAINVRTKDNSIEIPTPEGRLHVKPAHQESDFTEFSSEKFEVVGGQRFAHLLQREAGEVLLGCMEELNPGSQSQETYASTQPAECAIHETAMLKEFADVIVHSVPPGLPPERFLPDDRKLEHHIPLNPDAKPKSQQPYKLSSEEMTELLRAITKLTKQGWIQRFLVTLGLASIVPTKEERRPASMH
jgi:hypothetical protein